MNEETKAFTTENTESTEDRWIREQDTWSFAMLDDGSVDMQLRDHEGRELGRSLVPVLKPQDEDFRVVFSTRGKRRHGLQVEWIPITKMLGPWWWHWRWLRLEMRNLWRMLRR